MNVAFTQHAIERMQAREVDRTDIDRLLGLLDRVAETSGVLDHSPDVSPIRRSGEDAKYIARAGSLLAVLVTGTNNDSIVVASVYRRD